MNSLVKNFNKLSPFVSLYRFSYPPISSFCFTKFTSQLSFSGQTPPEHYFEGSRSFSTMATQEDYEAMGCTDAMQAQPFSLPPLPYAPSAMEPYVGKTTMMTHYGKHHATYVRKLNDMTKGTEFATMSLEEVVKKSTGGMFNQASQAWNHNFFWKCMTPNKQTPNGPAYDAMVKKYGSYENFQAEFVAKATGQFGSGWAWFTKSPTGEVFCESTPNGVNPMSTGSGTALMGVDVWEHAYYLDYKQDRATYVKNWFNTVNWDFVNENFNSA